MKINHLSVCAAALAGLCAVADAQYTGAVVNRPSDTSPSRLLGIVGGPGTNSGRGLPGVGPQLGYQAGIPAANAWSPGSGRRSPTFRTGFSTFRGAGSLSELGGGRTPFSSVLGAPSRRDISGASGYSASIALYTPIYGWGNDRVRLPDAPFFAPPPAEDRFNAMFGLSHSEPLTIPPPELVAGGAAAMIEQTAKQEAQELLQRAIRAFKAGTTNQPDRMDRLDEATRMLEGAQRLNRNDWLAPLLAVHAYLDKSQPASAIHSLALAVSRKPSLFVDKVDIASYYGDPALLEQQARSYLRYGDASGESDDRYALQAYCAWVLGDEIRVRAAIDKLNERAAQSKSGRSVLAIRYAIAATLP